MSKFNIGDIVYFRDELYSVSGKVLDIKDSNYIISLENYFPLDFLNREKVFPFIILIPIEDLDKNSNY